MPTHTQAKLGLSHIWRVQGSNPHQTQRLDEERMHFVFATFIQLNKHMYVFYALIVLNALFVSIKKLKAIPTNHERCAVHTSNNV